MDLRDYGKRLREDIGYGYRSRRDTGLKFLKLGGFERIRTHISGVILALRLFC